MDSFPFWRSRKVAGAEASGGASRAGGSVLSSDAEGGKEADIDYQYGIKVLHNCAGAIVDIVFVHGLTGNRLTTWTYKCDEKSEGLGKPWPESLLKKDIPNSRIMTFGYDANVVNLLSAASQNRVREHASSLNATLADIRDETGTSRRPIIMVAHSLGGIVCKEALLISESSPQSYLRNIYDCTRAIAFLGTPHGGSELANLGVVLGYGTNLLRKTNKDIIRVLKPDSEVLARVQQDFHNMLLMKKCKQPLNITCFFEELPMPGVGEIVPKHSATIPPYPSLGIHAHHKDMTKFGDRNNPGYRAVYGQIRRWVQEIEMDLTLAPDQVAAVDLDGIRDNCMRSLPVGISPKGAPIIYTQNNSGGGMLIQGNNINSANGSVYFGR